MCDVYVCLYVIYIQDGIYAMAYVWKTEDNFWELGLSFQCGFGDQTCVIRLWLVSSAFYTMSPSLVISGVTFYRGLLSKENSYIIGDFVIWTQWLLSIML